MNAAMPGRPAGSDLRGDAPPLAASGAASRGALVRGAIALGLVGAGAALAFIGAFWTAVGPGIVSYGFLLAVLGNAAAAVFAGLSTRSRGGAFLPLAGWTIVALLLGESPANGSVVITGTARGYGFLFGGFLAGLLVATFLPGLGDARARRRTPRRAQSPPGHGSG